MFLTLLSTQGATLGYEMLPLRGVGRIIRVICGKKKKVICGKTNLRDIR